MAKQCPVGTCAWATTPDGVRYCVRCKLVPCADPVKHAECTVLHPTPLNQNHHTPAFDAICDTALGGCGERYVWAPHAAPAAPPPRAVDHHHDAAAQRHGHEPRDIPAEHRAQLDAILKDAADAAKKGAP